MEASQLLPRNAPHPFWRPLDNVPSQRGSDPDALPRTVGGRQARWQQIDDAGQRALEEDRSARRLADAANQTEVEDDLQDGCSDDATHRYEDTRETNLANGL